MESILPLAFLLVTVGILLMGAELFVPTLKVLFAVGVACTGLGLVLTFFVSPRIGLFTLLAVFVVLPVVIGVGMHYGPRTPLGRYMFLKAPDAGATLAAMPENRELEQLRGRIGRTMGPLRPAGVVDFDGRRVDTLTEGDLVDTGVWVRCIDVQAGKVIVRPVPQPDLDGLETMELN